MTLELDRSKWPSSEPEPTLDHSAHWFRGSEFTRLPVLQVHCAGQWRESAIWWRVPYKSVTLGFHQQKMSKLKSAKEKHKLTEREKDFFRYTTFYLFYRVHFQIGSSVNPCLGDMGNSPIHLLANTLMKGLISLISLCGWYEATASSQLASSNIRTETISLPKSGARTIRLHISCVQVETLKLPNKPAEAETKKKTPQQSYQENIMLASSSF